MFTYTSSHPLFIFATGTPLAPVPQPQPHTAPPGRDMRALPLLPAFSGQSGARASIDAGHSGHGRSGIPKKAGAAGAGSGASPSPGFLPSGGAAGSKHVRRNNTFQQAAGGAGAGQLAWQGGSSSEKSHGGVGTEPGRSSMRAPDSRR